MAKWVKFEPLSDAGCKLWQMLHVLVPGNEGRPSRDPSSRLLSVATSEGTNVCKIDLSTVLLLKVFA